ncbi:PadR family transcriptional regulator [Edaphobacter aggregans]|uniref:PadR family transcriptional regulator n=1 Tax=Edaphobacter aggregans TaxID=570835 RepID=UPI0005579B83|nr:PadR family transcriptional regulator [Edaphobacter aggregans]
MPDNYEHLLPLSPATLHVLLALTREDLHGYGIMLEVIRQSAGGYKMGPGTLYDNLKKLMKLGLVDECTEDNCPAPARRLYHLNEAGRAVLAAETERLTEVLREARRCLRLSEGRQG